jgi:ComF family protein
LEALLWPAACLLCGRSGAGDIDLCSDCFADLPRNDTACAVCAEPLPAGAAAHACGECLRDPPPFAGSFVPYRYAYPLDHLVRGLKFRNELACGRVLGELFSRSLLARGTPLPEVIVPVPLAPRRYRARGYNQAVEVALAIQRCTGVAVTTDVVVRQRETAEQAGLDRKARRKNVRGAFTAVAPLRARSVAILDDVVTTGSTARELAAVLLQAGAERIEVWAIARTQPAT